MRGEASSELLDAFSPDLCHSLRRFSFIMGCLFWVAFSLSRYFNACVRLCVPDNSFIQIKYNLTIWECERILAIDSTDLRDLQVVLVKSKIGKSLPKSEK